MPWKGLGERIKRLRIERGLTQHELARRAKLSRIYIAKIEAGERASPSFPALERIARALGVRVRVDLVR